MTRATLTREVIGGLIGRVAGRTVCKASVIEISRLPRRRRVARTALAREVIGGFIGSVARRAVR